MQHSLVLGITDKRARHREFPCQIEKVVPCADLAARMFRFSPEGRSGRPQFSAESMLLIHFRRQLFA